MEHGIGTHRWWHTFRYAVYLSLILSPGISWGLEIGKTPPEKRRETISLADAALQALKQNLDITISRQTKESRQADITVEQARFDPTLSVNGQFNRRDRKSTRLNSSHVENLVCRLLLEKKKAARCPR